MNYLLYNSFFSANSRNSRFFSGSGFLSITSFLFFLLLTCTTHALANNSFTDVVRFASLDKAKELLTQQDDFTNSWSQFDIDSRLHRQNGTKEELLNYIASQALDWTEDEKNKILAIVSSIEDRISNEGFVIDFPDEIYFVKTTAAEEGGAGGYTRANYIVLKESMVSSPEERLKQTIVHELFHVLSRNNPDFRKQMYGIIGFEVANAVPYPDNIKHHRITNPDAPQTDAYIKLKANGVDVECMMVLYSDRDYDGGDFFKYLKVGFLQVKGEQVREVFLQDGKPVIHTIQEVSGFFEQVGNNTRYIIHPEEILADNFAYAVLGKTGLPNPEIVEEVIDLLK